MRVIPVACFVLLFPAAGVGFGGQRTEGMIQAAKDFAFEGLAFRTSLAQFKKRHPEAQAAPGSGGVPGVERFLIPSKEAKAVLVGFCEGRLYEMRVDYAGGEVCDEVLLGRFVKAFGKADAYSPGVITENPLEYQLIWNIRGADRLITMHRTRQRTRIHVLDTGALSRPREKWKR
jgi:hypothetical protein